MANRGYFEISVFEISRVDCTSFKGCFSSCEFSCIYRSGGSKRFERTTEERSVSLFVFFFQLAGIKVAVLQASCMKFQTFFFYMNVNDFQTACIKATEFQTSYMNVSIFQTSYIEMHDFQTFYMKLTEFLTSWNFRLLTRKLKIS